MDGSYESNGIPNAAMMSTTTTTSISSHASNKQRRSLSNKRGPQGPSNPMILSQVKHSINTDRENYNQSPHLTKKKIPKKVFAIPQVSYHTQNPVLDVPYT